MRIVAAQVLSDLGVSRVLSRLGITRNETPILQQFETRFVYSDGKFCLELHIHRIEMGSNTSTVQ